MSKTKITELKETLYKTKRIKNNDGTVTLEKIAYTSFKPVPVVEGWSRAGHYVLDLIIYYIFALIVAVPIVILLQLLGIDMTSLSNGEGWGNLLDRLITWLIIYPGYYFLFETSMQTTPGKFIFKRIVVNEYGEKPSLKVILKRSYCRVIPFEHFSCFSGLGWHDSMTNTFVIRKKDLEELNQAIKVQNFS